MIGIAVPEGWSIKLHTHFSRFRGDKLSYDVYHLSDQQGVAAYVHDLGYGKGNFHVSLNAIRIRYWKLLVINDCRTHPLAYDRTPQGDGTLQTAVNDAVQQLEKIYEFVGKR